MDNTTNTETYGETLSDAENDIVRSADSWLQEHPDAEWMQSKTSQYIEQCMNKSLLDQIWTRYPNEVNTSYPL